MSAMTAAYLVSAALIDPTLAAGTWLGSTAIVPAAGSASDVLTVDSGPTEPAVPLDVSLKVRSFAAERTIEIAVTIGKRTGYPATNFSDDVTAEISLPAGLTLESGALRWSGHLSGDETANFMATVRAENDVNATVSVKATGRADSGRIDAESEGFHVSAEGSALHVGLQSFQGSGVPSPANGTPVN